MLPLGPLGSSSIEAVHKGIIVNVSAQTYMSMFMMPKLLTRKYRSAVINLSSKASFFTRGFMPIYCATKRYNQVLSNSMREAYSDRVDVMTVTPSGVKTQMNPGTGPFTVQADDHAKSVMDHLGRYDETWGCWEHAY